MYLGVLRELFGMYHYRMKSDNAISNRIFQKKIEHKVYLIKRVIIIIYIYATSIKLRLILEISERNMTSFFSNRNHNKIKQIPYK